MKLKIQIGDIIFTYYIPWLRRLAFPSQQIVFLDTFLARVRKVMMQTGEYNLMTVSSTFQVWTLYSRLRILPYFPWQLLEKLIESKWEISIIMPLSITIYLNIFLIKFVSRRGRSRNIYSMRGCCSLSDFFCEGRVLSSPPPIKSASDVTCTKYIFIVLLHYNIIIDVDV